MARLPRAVVGNFIGITGDCDCFRRPLESPYTERFFHESAWERAGGGTAGDHKGLVKIPRIFLALPNSASLAPTD